jgi:membrane protein
MWRRWLASFGNWSDGLSAGRSRRLRVVAGASVVAARIQRRARLNGRAAEIAFWGVFSLPWIVMGAIATTALLARFIPQSSLDQFKSDLVATLSRFVTPEVVNKYVIPIRDEILKSGSASIGVIGFAFAIYGGSRLLATTVQSIASIHGSGERSYAMSRVLAIAVYAVLLLAILLAVPLLVLGPDLVAQWFPWASWLSTLGYWIVLVALVVGVLVGLYRLSPSPQLRWSQALPGTAVALAGLLVGSIGLRIYFAYLFRDGSIYTAIAAPIAVLLWAYVSALAVLVGATANVIMIRRSELESIGVDALNELRAP